MSDDARWAGWSRQALNEAGDAGDLVINQAVYAETSIRFSRIEDFERVLVAARITREPIPWAAAFLAGKLFLQYRRQGGSRRSPLPDFFIGSHAAVSGMPLLTRDPSRYRSYLPSLKLICP